MAVGLAGAGPAGVRPGPGPDPGAARAPAGSRARSSAPAPAARPRRRRRDDAAAAAAAAAASLTLSGRRPGGCAAVGPARRPRARRKPAWYAARASGFPRRARARRARRFQRGDRLRQRSAALVCVRRRQVPAQQGLAGGVPPMRGMPPDGRAGRFRVRPARPAHRVAPRSSRSSGTGAAGPRWAATRTAPGLRPTIRATASVSRPATTRSRIPRPAAAGRAANSREIAWWPRSRWPAQLHRGFWVRDRGAAPRAGPDRVTGPPAALVESTPRAIVNSQPRQAAVPAEARQAAYHLHPDLSHDILAASERRPAVSGARPGGLAHSTASRPRCRPAPREDAGEAIADHIGEYLHERDPFAQAIRPAQR